MPFYKYTAFNQEGLKVQGQLSSVSLEEAENQLTNLGLKIANITESSEPNLTSNKITTKELTIICMQLEQLEKAGVPLIDGLSDIKENTNHAILRSVFEDIYNQVSQGKLLSEAMSSHKNIFDNVFIGLISTGEHTGNLAQSFSHLVEHLKWAEEIKMKIKKATYRPLFMFLLIMSMIAIVMIYIAPKLSSFLTSQTFELPWHTKALINTSRFVSEHGFLIIFFPISIFSTVKLAANYIPYVAYKVDLLKLHIPIIGPVIRKIEIARFFRFFATTFRSGIDISQAIDISRNVIENQVIKVSLELTWNTVNEGYSLSNAMEAAGNFPNLVTRIIKVGEDSGKLNIALENINYFFDREVADSVDNMIGILQPTLTIILGMTMLWVTTAVLGPLYSILGKISL